ncbi:TRAP transporter large permease [Natrinema sp. SYSU A 869]|uniref:TRAP transporter large permease n=1 Tax=Natrinema sp. SYSU A 869 TaxID=2871694 RepID=UPI001CA468AE|nr:TRAP transporter large permease [Natrinema sp. SYSU A 869]
MDLVLIALFIIVLLVLYLIGIPVAFALGLTSLILMLTPMVSYSPELVAQTLVSGADSFVLLAIPLFLLTGLYMNSFGLTNIIFDFAEEMIGPIRGGIAHVNILASLLFSGMTGTAAADAAGLGAIEYEAMQDAGYEKGYSAAVTGSSAIIGPIIPPSVPLIMYGVLAQVSIGVLFIAGIVPGLIMGATLLLLCTYYAYSHGYERGTWWSLPDIWRSFKAAAPALGTPVLIIGGLLGGFFTATEAGAVALFYTLFVGYVFYGGVENGDFIETTYEGVVTTAALTFIVASATLYGFLIRRAQLPDALAEAVVGVTGDPTVLLLMIVGVLLIVGLMMETIAAITILTPVFLPVINVAGIDPIHFGIVMILTLMIGLLTPPFGIILFILEKVTDVGLERIMRSMVPFYIPLLIILLLVAVLPSLTLWLPKLVGLI